MSAYCTSLVETELKKTTQHIVCEVFFKKNQNKGSCGSNIEDSVEEVESHVLSLRIL